MDYMSRLKTFAIYLIMFVAFYLFSSIAAYFYILSTYAPMEGEIVESSDVKVEIDEAKSTLVNGNIKGKITNASSNKISNKYIKIDLISKLGNKILTKYVYAENLDKEETQDFKINFQAENIKTFKVEVRDEVEEV